MQVRKAKIHAPIDIVYNYRFLLFQYLHQKWVLYHQDKLRVLLDDYLGHSDHFGRRIVIKLIQELKLLNEVSVDLISDRLKVHFLGVETFQVT